MANISFGNNVPLRTPHRRNVEAFTKALDKIDEKAKESLQTQNQIQMALANLDVNGAEDNWKAAYARNIQNQLDDAAVYGDYSRSLNTARVLAGQVASDPAVLGRVKAQAAYKQFNDNLDKRQDITQDVKDWAKAQNPYHYEDKFDDEGHLVGGSTWEPNKTPVSTVDLSNLMTKAKQWVAVHKGNGVSDIKFVDANGNLTSDPSQNVYGLAYKKSGNWEYVSEKDLNDALKSAIDTTPGARASLQQDYDVALWKYNKMSDEEKKKNIDSDITENGLLLSPEEYLAKRVKPGIHAMSYYNSGSDIDVGNGLAAYRQDVAARQADAQQQTVLNGLNLDATNEGAAIDVDVPDIIGTTKAGLDNTLSALKTLFPNLSKSAAFNRGVTQGRYDELANLCRHSITTKDPVKLHQARQAITALRNYGNQYNTYVKGLNSNERQAVEFDAARRSGSKLPTNNVYSANYNRQINALFHNGNVKEAGYKCANDEQFNNIGRALGCNSVSDWARKGFKIVEINGQKTIAFNKNNTYLSQLGDAINNSQSLFGKIGSAFANLWNGGTGVVNVDNGRPIAGGINILKDMSTNDVVGIDYFKPASASPAQSAKIVADKVNNRRGFGKVPVNSKVYNSSIEKQRLYDALRDGDIKSEDYNIALKRLDDEEASLTNTSFLMNAPLYINGQRIPENEKADYIELIEQAKQENALNINVGRNHGLAQTVTEYNIGKGKESKPMTITMVGANGSSMLTSFENDTATKARDIATQLIISGTSKTLANGSTISRVTNNGAILTKHGVSRPINRNELENILNREIARQEIADNIYTQGLSYEHIAQSIKTYLKETGENDDDLHTLLEYNNIIKNY